MLRHVSLDCIRNFYSDGSSQVRGAVCADNGLVYKIERVLAVDEGQRAAARVDLLVGFASVPMRTLGRFV